MLAFAAVVSMLDVGAIAAGDDVRRATIVGVGGQLYDADGSGGWVRTKAGGVGDDVAVAVRVGDAVIAGAADSTTAKGPPFRERGGVWEIVPIALHAHAVIARGTRAVAAAGKQVFDLGVSSPKALPDAPGIVQAIGASASGIAIATDHGVARLDGARWRPVDGAPGNVVGFANDRWAITATGAVDLTSRATASWPSGVAPTAFAADAAGDLVAAGGGVVVVVRAGQTKVDRDALPAGAADGVVAAVAIDHDNRIVVALRDGRVAVRDHATWTTTTLRDSLPATRAGSPPATAQ